jgi:hypothetical protein
MTEQNALSAFVPPEPDLSKLPVDFYPGPTPLFGLILMLAGVLGPIFILLTLGTLWLFRAEGEEWGWVVLVFAAIPLLGFPWGWWVIRSRTIVRVGAETVEYMRVTPLRTSRWDAPLGQYSAVAYRLLLPPSSSKAGETYHAVDLIHRGGERTVRLVQASQEAMARDVQARLAALTGLPAEDHPPERQ